MVNPRDIAGERKKKKKKKKKKKAHTDSNLSPSRDQGPVSWRPTTVQ